MSQGQSDNSTRHDDAEIVTMLEGEHPLAHDLSHTSRRAVAAFEMYESSSGRFHGRDTYVGATRDRETV